VLLGYWLILYLNKSDYLLTKIKIRVLSVDNLCKNWELLFTLTLTVFFGTSIYGSGLILKEPGIYKFDSIIIIKSELLERLVRVGVNSSIVASNDK
jgi:hypothetical protein